ncbi:iron-sulfur cluster assembly scaffold protein [Thermosulfurimonas sp. F29]|uniref:iron-sulfur cluster assembly scaffold protein n=1 Tax=Thermosulfurimonas sp. F29 TaxID=2867247 RepID=UPI001C82C73D|nr:iron-sulfur cluster assembly scaffold protein [Thermosulfurimonas sp. F29]MBX6422614.1 iron-sulfur cluster assembly scaffold protein [Thermosulfurimonas sp. F29]
MFTEKYTDKVMEHFAHPRNVGTIEDADGVGEVGNPACGDMMTFYIRVQDGRIAEIKYKTFGCVAAIAVASVVSELAKGKTLEEAKALRNEDIARELGGLPKQKWHCSVLGLKALREAIEDYEARVSGKPRQKTTRPKRKQTCPSCGVENPLTARFCMNCGTALEGSCGS